MKNKKRLDVLLTERGLAESRAKAQAIIMSGAVFVAGQKADKAGQEFDAEAPIEVRGHTCPYVSRDYQAAQNATVIMVSHSMEEVAANVSRLVVMNGGRVAMTGTPREVFSHAEELETIGLDVPELTRVFLALRRQGVDVPTAIFTPEQAAQAILALRQGGVRHA